MTFKFNNVYLKEVATIAGPYEKKGPLGNLFDKTYKDLYCEETSWERAEVHLLNESMKKVLKKSNLTKEDIDLLIAGDLLNQISSSSYAAYDLGKPFLGIYNACATNTEALIIGSSLISSKYIKKCICSVSSHNMSSENPTEYGAPKPKTATFTSTGGASAILTDEKTNIKIESGTIGKIMDLEQKDPLNMGAVMAPAAAETIYQHLTDTNRDPNYYDLILTGDLGLYDCGIMLYSLKKQKEILAGGSGPVCSALVLYTTVLEQMRQKNIKRVLMVATGALFNPNFVFQKENILSIAHAVSLEVI